MAVVLSILKWIGIVLGCLVLGILALALLILLVVLFVPFRYQATVATDETKQKKILYGFGITWILHAVSVRKKVDSDQIVIRILGIPVKRIGGDAAGPADTEWEEDIGEDDTPDDTPDYVMSEPSEEEGSPPEAQASDVSESTARITESVEEEAGASAGASDEERTEASEDENQNPIDETLIETSEEISEDENRKKKRQDKKDKTEVENGESEEKSEKKPPFPVRIANRIRDKVNGIKQKIRHTFKKIGFIFYKLSSIIEFVKDRAARQTIKKLVKEVVKAIRYVGPKKISGTLEFGTGDPGSTGMILAGVSLCRFSYKKDVTIRPNFEEKILVGDCTVRGRIRVVYFVRMALRIWFNKDVHRLWKNYRRMKKDFKRESRQRGLDAAA